MKHTKKNEKRKSNDLVLDMGRAIFPKFTYLLWSENKKQLLAHAAAVTYMLNQKDNSADHLWDQQLSQSEIMEIWYREFEFLLNDPSCNP